MSGLLVCQKHPNEAFTSECPACLKLQYEELRLAGQRAAGQLRAILELGMYAPESFAHMRAAYELLKEFDKPKTEKREGRS